MKTTLLPLAGLLLAAVSGPAALISETYNTGFSQANIEDGNPNPWSDTRTISSAPAGHIITDVMVRLNLSGGFNGDLYGYLSYNGVLVTLLNRVGVGTGNSFGYADAGLNVTFSDAAPENIHFYQSVAGFNISGGASWQPDGRTTDPAAMPFDPSAFDAAGTQMLSDYDGLSPNGDWSLVLADLSPGGGDSMMVSWGLDVVTAVPEPANVALGIFAGIMLIGWAWRRFRPA